MTDHNPSTAFPSVTPRDPDESLYETVKCIRQAGINTVVICKSTITALFTECIMDVIEELKTM